MEVYRKSSWLFLLLGVALLSTALQGVQGEVESEGPSESECRPYIEKALKELETVEGDEAPISETGGSIEDFLAVDNIKDDSDSQQSVDEGERDDHAAQSVETTESASVEGDAPVSDQEGDTQEERSAEQAESVQSDEVDSTKDEVVASHEEAASSETVEEQTEETVEEQAESVEEPQTVASVEETSENVEETEETQSVEEPQADEAAASTEEAAGSVEDRPDTVKETDEQKDASAEQETVETEQTEPTETEEQAESVEVVPTGSAETEEAQASAEDAATTAESVEEAPATDGESVEEPHTAEESVEDPEKQEEAAESVEAPQTVEESVEEPQPAESVEETAESVAESAEEPPTVDAESVEEPVTQITEPESVEEVQADAPVETTETEPLPAEETPKSEEQTAEEPEIKSEEGEDNVMEELAEKAEEEQAASEEKDSNESAEPVPEEDLILDIEIPENLRDRQHVEHLLKLDDESSDNEKIINKISDVTLRELKKLYENAIKPLEVLYKYRDLSNRHFGDAEIFSKPLVLFMGPWSGGKSSIINYLTNNEFNETSLRTGAEPSPAYFNLLMYGDEPEVIDGTELAADFTFSGLQKFGQGLEERLRGVRLNNKLLEKVNIVEIPGILEVRKQVSRLFPFNDACQWFIDRADIIFLVYDPSKLDVGPETEAILDQLKGREHQTRIILNKADQVKPEELMRVQGALIWNISPLMSSPQPPVMYTTSLWSRPYETWAPTRLLQAQERAFLRDLRGAIDKRIENKIASARRFAVRVRNHAKMVDCYLTTYYNHKSVFGNRKQVADEIIERPQDYHIYEGLSTLTNISRYDLPDPEVYKDFFKLNALYEFQQLSATCTYFRGCPINRLDVAIAYDLPELVGTHRRLVENALTEANAASAPPPAS